MFRKLGTDIVLGLLVATLSVFTAAANYATYKIGGVGSAHTATARQLLADSNTDYDIALQLIILDYSMYDGFYINNGVDDVAAEHYLGNFSDALKASVERDTPFDDQYYDQLYAPADKKSHQAEEEFAKADQAFAKEAVLRLAMLLAALGLAFGAYASLLKEDNHMRSLFALMALIILIINLSQFWTAFTL